MRSTGVSGAPAFLVNDFEIIELVFQYHLYCYHKAGNYDSGLAQKVCYRWSTTLDGAMQLMPVSHS